jgi:hypothetical protein
MEYVWIIIYRGCEGYFTNSGSSKIGSERRAGRDRITMESQDT